MERKSEYEETIEAQRKLNDTQSSVYHDVQLIKDSAPLRHINNSIQHAYSDKVIHEVPEQSLNTNSKYTDTVEDSHRDDP